MSHAPFGFAVVGTGEISGFYLDHFHRRADREGLRFAGCFDLCRERSETLAARYGTVSYPSLDALLADGAVQAVVNLTPARAHAAVTRACLDAGRHVLSEKPLAMDAAEADSLVALAAAQHVTLAAAPFILLGARQQQVRALLREGSIGRPVLATADLYHGRMESWNARAAAFYEVSGGPLFDVGPYPVSLFLDWFGPVAAVQAIASTGLPERRGGDGAPFRLSVPDHAVLLLRFVSGLLGRIDISCVDCRSDRHGLEIHAAEGSLTLSSIMDFDGELRLARPGGSAWEVLGGSPAPKPASGVDWATGLYELAHAVREERPPANSGALGRDVVRVLAAAVTAARERREVALTP